ncbi:MAG: cell division protein ZapA [Lachnospiraceae bacterium]|jgi:cell division protein ZapA|nr:cell division protein ZapA [Lachnospiraceae bacterium]RKJ50114.1 cell division protein ZapA [bacterium 1XD42-54]
MSSKNTTQVIIAGKIYTLSGYESEEYLQRVATYLNAKISELKNMDGYVRLSPDLRNILLNLNTADDYFKMKKKVEELERELSEKDKELYDFKHELITAQIKLENAEKEAQLLQEKNVQLQKENIQLDTRLKNQNKR